MRFIFAILFLLSLAACTTTPQAPEAPIPSTRPSLPTEPSKNEFGNIDYVGLQRSMGMEIPTSQLGYKEKSFDTCKAGYGYSSSHNCHREFMVVINFQLQCRDSEGTVAQGVTNADLTAIANKSVRWTLKPNQGTTQTDSEGFGQVMTVASRSPKSDRIKIGVGNEFLYMRANELTRVVTPQPWCHQ